MKACISIIVNDRFIKGAIVTLYSFFKYNKWFDGDIIILHDNKYCILSEANKVVLKNAFENIIFKECVPEHYTAILPKLKNANKRFMPALYTLEAFGLEEYDKVLYMDADLAFVGDIRSFYMDTTFVCAVPTNRRMDRGLKAPKMRKGQAFNSGILIINNPSKEIYNDIISTDYKFDEKFTGTYPDQDILNLYLLNKPVKLYPVTYNDCKSGFSRNIDLNSTKVIHYLGPVKPWSEIIPENTYINVGIWNYFWKNCRHLLSSEMPL